MSIDPSFPAVAAALDDPLRLAALADYGILDTAPEAGFDDIVQLARQICGAPVALVSLVAGDRQWFKARDGFPLCQTDLSSSVCMHALVEPDVLVIPDLATDPRSRNNPLVMGPPYIQFYAGAPLRTPEGFVLGSLCVIDHRPRREGLSEARQEALRALARQVVTQLEQRRAQSLLQTITDHVSQAIFRLDRAGLMTFANPAAERLFGWPAGDLIGRSLHQALHHSHPDGQSYPAEECPLRQALNTGAVLKDHEDTFFHRDGTPINVQVTNAPVRVDGGCVGAVLTVTDITARVKAEAALRVTDRLTAALLSVGDRLRELSHIPDMTREAGAIVGQVLGASRIGFGMLDTEGDHVTIEPDWTAPGQVSVAGTHRFADYGHVRTETAEGRPVVITDVRTDRRTADDPALLLSIDVVSLVNMPVRERGRTTTLFFVHDNKPRAWSDEVLRFLRAVADRVEVGIARVRAEEQQELVNRELSHRMKNLLAMVQAIATQSLRTAADLKTGQDVLSGRLIALGRAHDLLMGGALTSTDMAAVVRAALDLHNDGHGRLTVDGPQIEIGTEQALSLALMLHELATNAAKYGALSTDSGQVAVAWALVPAEPEPLLRLTWTESGGPPVMPPTRKGFGTRFIERGLAAQVNGDLDLGYPPTGLTCRLEATLSAFQRGN